MDPGREPVEAERREQGLVQRYKAHLEAQGHKVTRHLYTPFPGARTLACDLFRRTDRVLVEAKGRVRRESVRMAVGQLFDYLRFEAERPSRSVVLLPREPSPDLVDLVHCAGFDVLWEAGRGVPRGDPWLRDGWPAQTAEPSRSDAQGHRPRPRDFQ